MTEKELRRLRRHDLLQLLLLQSKENLALREEIDQLTERNQTLEDDRKRLKSWLDEKDETIRSLESKIKNGRGANNRGTDKLGTDLSLEELLETIKSTLDQRRTPQDKAGPDREAKPEGRKKKKKKRAEERLKEKSQKQ